MAKVGYIFEANSYDAFDADKEWMRQYGCVQVVEESVDLLEKNIPGFALCEFTIDKEGVILRPHIVRSTHPEFAEEALRIVKGMPKWAPALVEGKPTDSNYTLYIPFRPQNYRAK